MLGCFSNPYPDREVTVNRLSCHVQKLCFNINIINFALMSRETPQSINANALMQRPKRSLRCLCNL